jgi:hypothetical protein
MKLLINNTPEAIFLEFVVEMHPNVPSIDHNGYIHDSEREKRIKLILLKLKKKNTWRFLGNPRP